jgi:hypothetical protein
LKSWKKKINAVLKMEAPKSLKQRRGLHWHGELLPRHVASPSLCVLAPLMAKTGAPKKGKKQAKFLWTPKMQSAFEQMKALMAMDALGAYPNHNKPFHVYTDASDYQLGACIMQDGLPMAYYSEKLNNAQRNYSTVDKELLSIVMTQWEF